MVNTRRELLLVLAVGSVSVPFGSLSQEVSRVWRVGFLVQERRPPSLDKHRFGAFPEGMRELGYVEGKNLVIEWRFADGFSDRLPTLAAELVRDNVDVMVAAATQATAAAQRATTTIPIVMVSTGDPIGSGFVKELAHPDGNITGLSNLTGELGPKHLELLIALIPRLSRVAVLKNPANSTADTILRSIQLAAQKSDVTVLPIEAGDPREIAGAFSRIAAAKVEAVILAPDALFSQEASQIAGLAMKARLPCIDGLRESAEQGILMSYGQNRAQNYKLAATYVDKIFKGAKPRDLPVEQAGTFELFINSKTALALGIKIPNSILMRADKVIQ